MREGPSTRSSSPQEISDILLDTYWPYIYANCTGGFGEKMWEGTSIWSSGPSRIKWHLIPSRYGPNLPYTTDLIQIMEVGLEGFDMIYTQKQKPAMYRSIDLYQKSIWKSSSAAAGSVLYLGNRQCNGFWLFRKSEWTNTKNEYCIMSEDMVQRPQCNIMAYLKSWVWDSYVLYMLDMW